MRRAYTSVISLCEAMKTLFLLLLAGIVRLGIAPANAQCRSHIGYANYHRRAAARQDSGVVKKPFEPGRVGAFGGVLGLRDRSGTSYVGGDLEGSYFLSPRWSTGLRGTFTRPARIPALASGGYEGAGRPQAQIFSLTWRNALLLVDRPRWRVGALAGVGIGWLNLRDKDQQVIVRGQGRCGCQSATRSKLFDTTWNPVSEIGLTATYKPRKADAPWLTLRGQYRAWQGDVPFGGPGQFSHYLLSAGLSLPDAPRQVH